MRCETCFWVKSGKPTSGTTSAICEYKTESEHVSLNGRCSNWTFNGKPACKDCRYYDRGFCALRVPAKTDYSEQRCEDDWCGQFKGRVVCDDGTLWLGSYQRREWEEMPPIPLACDELQELGVPQKAPERRVLIVTHKKNDERARTPGDRVTLIKPTDLDRLTRGSQFDRVIIDEGIIYSKELDQNLRMRCRATTNIEYPADFFEAVTRDKEWVNQPPINPR